MKTCHTELPLLWSAVETVSRNPWEILGRTLATFHQQGWHESGGVEVPKSMFNVVPFFLFRALTTDEMSWGHWWPKSQTQKVERWICWTSQNWELCWSMRFAPFYFLIILIYINNCPILLHLHRVDSENKRFWVRMTRCICHSSTFYQATSRELLVSCN